jgi:hypothetical protein
MSQGAGTLKSVVRWTLTIAIFAFCGFLSIDAQTPAKQTDTDVQRYLAKLKGGNVCERAAAIRNLHHMGKRVIPVLIQRIGDSEIANSSTLMLANPALSYAPPGSQCDEYSGLLYAYVVELILARESLHTASQDCNFLFKNLGDYAYPHGLIVKNEKVIQASDLPKIKQLYSLWWGKHNNESLLSLRRDWAKSIRPLSGSEYGWM